MALVGDPVGVGLVNNLAHPGANITGLTSMSTELTPKRLQLLKEAVPSIKRVGVLWNPTTPVHNAILANLKAVAPQLQLELVPVGVHRVDQFDAAFSTLSRSKADAVLVLDDPFLVDNGTALVQLAAKARVPAVVGAKSLAKRGALISYGTQLTDLFRRAAGYAKKIFKGANPADLPIEQPTQFFLSVNLHTARSLGLKIPESILLRADEVIQ